MAGVFKCHQLELLARRIIKANRIVFCFPDRRQFHAAWSVEAKENATDRLTAFEKPFGDLMNSFFEIALLTQSVRDQFSKLSQVVTEVARLPMHMRQLSPE